MLHRGVISSHETEGNLYWGNRCGHAKMRPQFIAAGDRLGRGGYRRKLHRRYSNKLLGSGNGHRYRSSGGHVRGDAEVAAVKSRSGEAWKGELSLPLQPFDAGQVTVNRVISERVRSQEDRYLS